MLTLLARPPSAHYLAFVNFVTFEQRAALMLYIVLIITIVVIIRLAVAAGQGVEAIRRTLLAAISAFVDAFLANLLAIRL